MGRTLIASGGISQGHVTERKKMIDRSRSSGRRRRSGFPAARSITSLGRFRLRICSSCAASTNYVSIISSLGRGCCAICCGARALSSAAGIQIPHHHGRVNAHVSDPICLDPSCAQMPSRTLSFSIRKLATPANAFVRLSRKATENT